MKEKGNFTPNDELIIAGFLKDLKTVNKKADIADIERKTAPNLKAKTAAEWEQEKVDKFFGDLDNLLDKYKDNTPTPKYDPDWDQIP